MSEQSSEAKDLGLSDETIQSWKRLGVIGTNEEIPDHIKQFLDPAHRTTATDKELLEFLDIEAEL